MAADMWYVVRNDELGASAVVHRDALEHHRNRGWVRLSDEIGDKDSINLADYAEAPDLDAEPEVQAPSRSALKPEWVRHAVDRGADPDRAERATKDQLVEAYGPGGSGELPAEATSENEEN